MSFHDKWNKLEPLPGALISCVLVAEFELLVPIKDDIGRFSDQVNNVIA